MIAKSILAGSLMVLALSSCSGESETPPPPPPIQGPTQPPVATPPPVTFEQRPAEIFIEREIGELVTLGYFHAAGSGIAPIAPAALTYRPTDTRYVLSLPFDMSGIVTQTGPDRVEGRWVLRPATNFDSIEMDLVAPGLGEWRNDDVALFIGGAGGGNPATVWFHLASIRPTPLSELATTGTISYGGEGTGGAATRPHTYADALVGLYVNHDDGTVSGFVHLGFTPCFMSCANPSMRYNVSGAMDDSGRMTLELVSETLGLTGTAVALFAGPEAGEAAIAFRVEAPAVDSEPAQIVAGAARLRLGMVPHVY